MQVMACIFLVVVVLSFVFRNAFSVRDYATVVQMPIRCIKKRFGKPDSIPVENDEDAPSIVEKQPEDADIFNVISTASGIREFDIQPHLAKASLAKLSLVIVCVAAVVMVCPAGVSAKSIHLEDCVAACSMMDTSFKRYDTTKLRECLDACKVAEPLVDVTKDTTDKYDALPAPSFESQRVNEFFPANAQDKYLCDSFSGNKFTDCLSAQHVTDVGKTTGTTEGNGSGFITIHPVESQSMSEDPENIFSEDTDFDDTEFGNLNEELVKDTENISPSPQSTLTGNLSSTLKGPRAPKAGRNTLDILFIAVIILLFCAALYLSVFFVTGCFFCHENNVISRYPEDFL